MAHCVIFPSPSGEPSSAGTANDPLRDTNGMFKTFIIVLFMKVLAAPELTTAGKEWVCEHHHNFTGKVIFLLLIFVVIFSVTWSHFAPFGLDLTMSFTSAKQTHRLVISVPFL